MPRLNNKKGFLSIIELIASLAIICFLAYFFLNNYFKPFVGESTVTGPDGKVTVSSPSYKAVVDSAREQVQGATKKALERSSQLEDLTNN